MQCDGRAVSRLDFEPEPSRLQIQVVYSFNGFFSMNQIRFTHRFGHVERHR